MAIELTKMTEIALEEYVTSGYYNFLEDDLAQRYINTLNLDDKQLFEKLGIGSDNEWILAPDSSKKCVLKINYRLDVGSKFEKVCAGSDRIWGLDEVLKDAGSPTPVYITDDPISALAISICEFPCAVVSREEQNLFIDLLVQNGGTNNILLLAYSNTTAGRMAEKELSFKLDMTGLCCKSENLFPFFKNASEALAKDQETFIDNLIASSANVILDSSEEARKYYEDNSDFSFLDKYVQERDSCAYTAIPTDIDALDELLDGGLYPGLYIFGGQSKMGKTTLLNQIARNIARNHNRNVVMFCLEMTKAEMISKTLSHETFMISGGVNALGYRQIHDGKRFKRLTQEQRNTYDEALEEYRKYSKRIDRRSSLGIVTMDDIKDRVNECIVATKRPPVVFVDYLQVVQHKNSRLTEKQIIDHNMLNLKKLSQDNKAVVIVISSLNRNSYGDDLELSAFNGSSAIEYFADFAFGIQLPKDECEDKDNVEKLLCSSSRPAEIKILKDRFGGGTIRTKLTFEAAYNTFLSINKGSFAPEWLGLFLLFFCTH